MPGEAAVAALHAPTRCLCLVKCRICLPVQVIAWNAIIGSTGETNAYADLQRTDPVERIALPGTRLDNCLSVCRAIGRQHVRCHDHELIPAQSRQDVAVTNDGEKPAGDGLQDAVAGLVAEIVVDRLAAV